MEFVIKISQFLLSLSLLIILHELGHFIPAKAFKTRVEKFYLFFDVKFSLFKKKIGETVYGIGWLPLGGYVKISGMIDESMDTEQMAQEPQPWEFRSKPAWQRLIIMLGGVTVNFILAYIIYVFVSFVYGDTDFSAGSLKDGYWIEHPVLNDLGFKTGDKIIAIDGENISAHSDVMKKVISGEEYQIERDGKLQTIEMPEDFLGQLSSRREKGSLFRLRIPLMIGELVDTLQNKDVDLKEGDILISINNKNVRYYDQLSSVLDSYKGGNVQANFLRENDTISRSLRVDSDGKLGIIAAQHLERFDELGYLEMTRREYTFLQSFGGGLEKFTDQIVGYWEQLTKIFNPKTGAYKGLGGFKAIYDIFPATWSWADFWMLTAFLSIMLGVLNLLPIPALDGGHVMFLLYEMVSGRKPGDKFMEYAQMVGFVILIALVLFANGNDIFKAVSN